jgi:hypothetical protein
MKWMGALNFTKSTAGNTKQINNINKIIKRNRV